MFILVHRRSEKLLKQEIKYLRGEFIRRNIGFIDYDYMLEVSKLNAKIVFFAGDLIRTAGIRPDYFDTDDTEAYYFIRQSAVKVNGIQISNIRDIVNIILRLQKKYEEEKELTDFFEFIGISKQEFMNTVNLYKLKKDINAKFGIEISDDWDTAVGQSVKLDSAYKLGYKQGIKDEREMITKILKNVVGGYIHD